MSDYWIRTGIKEMFFGKRNVKIIKELVVDIFFKTGYNVRLYDTIFGATKIFLNLDCHKMGNFYIFQTFMGNW